MDRLHPSSSRPSLPTRIPVPQAWSPVCPYKAPCPHQEHKELQRRLQEAGLPAQGCGPLSHAGARPPAASPSAQRQAPDSRCSWGRCSPAQRHGTSPPWGSGPAETHTAGGRTALYQVTGWNLVYAARCPPPRNGVCHTGPLLSRAAPRCPPACRAHAGVTRAGPQGGHQWAWPQHPAPSAPAPHMSRQHGLFSAGASSEGAVSLSRGGSPPALEPHSG